METRSSSTILRLSARALGNFLSGMETGPEAGSPGRTPALETSLVEWKPQSITNGIGPFMSLGNFLSGMETRDAKRPRRG